MPLYVANFILTEYGEGAIFGCPAHDQRDLEFAQKYDLPIIPVICEEGTQNIDSLKETCINDGVMFNSEF